MCTHVYTHVDHYSRAKETIEKWVWYGMIRKHCIMNYNY